MERRGCKKVGRVQVFLDRLFEGNLWGRTAGGRQVDIKGAGSEACERETDGGEGNCREDCAELYEIPGKCRTVIDYILIRKVTEN